MKNLNHENSIYISQLWDKLWFFLKSQILWSYIFRKKRKIFNLNCRNKIFCILIFCFFAFFIENAVCKQPKKREYWPTGGWKTSIPEQQGMDSAKLLVADEFIQNRLPDAFSLLVVKNGYLVPERKGGVLRVSPAADAQLLNYYGSKWWRSIAKKNLAAFTLKLDLRVH